jgi:hypothetical protein
MGDEAASYTARAATTNRSALRSAAFFPYGITQYEDDWTERSSYDQGGLTAMEHAVGGPLTGCVAAAAGDNKNDGLLPALPVSSGPLPDKISSVVTSIAKAGPIRTRSQA